MLQYLQKNITYCKQNQQLTQTHTITTALNTKK